MMVAKFGISFSRYFQVPTVKLQGEKPSSLDELPLLEHTLSHGNLLSLRFNLNVVVSLLAYRHTDHRKPFLFRYQYVYMSL